MIFDPRLLLLPYRRRAEGASVGVNIAVDLSARWDRDLAAYLANIPGLRVGWIDQRTTDGSLPMLAAKVFDASRRVSDPFVTGERMPANPLTDAVGTLGVVFGDGSTEPFWRDAAEDRAVSATRVVWQAAQQFHRSERALPGGRGSQTPVVVREAETPTDPGLYFTRTGEEAIAAAIRMLGGVCAEIVSDPDGWSRRAASGMDIDAPAASSVSSVEAATFAARKLWRSYRVRKTASRGKYGWFTAIRPNRGAGVLSGNTSGFHRIRPPAGCSEIADPFLAEHDGRSWLLYEDTPVGSSRAHLSCAALTADGEFVEPRPILEKPYHLSYPFVFDTPDGRYLLPESSESGRLDLYRFVAFPDRLEHVATLAEDLPIVDVTPIEADGRWYFFAGTTQPFAETFLFTSDRLEGKWELHPASPVSSSIRNCRGAGKPFRANGSLYRPSQDCSRGYGYATRVNEITRLTPTEFEEREVALVPPTWAPDLIGTHTWNECSRFQVVDGLGFIDGPNES